MPGVVTVTIESTMARPAAPLPANTSCRARAKMEAAPVAGGGVCAPAPVTTPANSAPRTNARISVLSCRPPARADAAQGEDEVRDELLVGRQARRFQRDVRLEERRERIVDRARRPPLALSSAGRREFVPGAK